MLYCAEAYLSAFPDAVFEMSADYDQLEVWFDRMCVGENLLRSRYAQASPEERVGMEQYLSKLSA